MEAINQPNRLRLSWFRFTYNITCLSLLHNRKIEQLPVNLPSKKSRQALHNLVPIQLSSLHHLHHQST